MNEFDEREVGYIEGAKRYIPGLDSLHRMVAQLLAEHVPVNGRVLVVGAGGGLELKALAGQHPAWSFDGVDPSSDMITLAKETTANCKNSIRLYQGDIKVAPDGPYDGAVCLMVFHHISPNQRRDTLHGIHKRLRLGSPLVVAHVSFPQCEPERSLWIDRHIKFGALADISVTRQDAARAGMKERLFVSAPEEEEVCLREAGFNTITPFFQAFSFRGWVAYTVTRG